MTELLERVVAQLKTLPADESVCVQVCLPPRSFAVRLINKEEAVV